MAQRAPGEGAAAPAGTPTSSPAYRGERETSEQKGTGLASRLPVPSDISGALEKEERFLGKEEEGERVRSYTPGHFDADVERIVCRLQRLLRARTMSQHVSALIDAYAKDLVWDAPPALFRGRDNVRTALYLSKTFVQLDLEPELVQVVRLPDLKSHLVEISGTMEFRPRRSLWVWPTLLLPKSVPLKMMFKLGVTGNLEDGQIELLYDRPHNLPGLPTPVRVLNGWIIGNLSHLTEPLWGPIAGFLGDDYYKRQYQTGRLEPRRLVEPIREAVPRVGETAEEAARRVADTARRAAEKVYEPIAKAADVVRSPVDAGSRVGRPEGGETARRVYAGERGGAGGVQAGSANAPENPYGTATGALVGGTPVGAGGWNNM